MHRARVRDDPGRSPQIELDPERSFDGPLSGQSVYEQTSGVLRHTGTGLEAGAGAKVELPTRPPTRRHHFTVPLGSSQGTNPRTGGHSKRKTPLTESVCISSGTSGRCSCRNFGTCLHYNSNASSGPVRRDGLFWDFGSLFQKASRCQTASCCGSYRAVSEKTLRRLSSRLLRQRKLGNGPLRSQSCSSRRVHLCPGVQIRKDCAQLSVQLRLCLLGGL